MFHNKNFVSPQRGSARDDAKQGFILLSIISIAAIIVTGQYWHAVYWLFIIVLQLILLGTYDIFQKNHTILRIYPVVGHGRYLFESVRKEIQQYFVESDLDGTPISREFRSMVYQRARKITIQGHSERNSMFTVTVMNG